MTAALNSSDISKLSGLSYDKYYDNLTKICFSARWLVRADIQNCIICVLTEVKSGFSSKIRTIPPKSRQLDTGKQVG